MIRIGIIGTGNTIGIARNHINAYKLCDDAVITAVFDIVDGKAQKYIDEFELKDAKACISLEELFSLVDAVSICTPNATHTQLAIQALKAGKHVLSEKPFGTTPEECDEAIKWEKLTGKVAMVGLCYRDMPGIVTMKKYIDEGKIGQVYYVRGELGGDRIANPEVKLEWRMQKDLSGPGAVADFGSHLMDFTDYLLRKQCGPITTVQCVQNTFIKEREVINHPGKMGKVTNDDVSHWICTTENGTLYSFTASRIGAAFLVEIVGSGGKLVFNGSRPFELQVQLKDMNGGYTQKMETIPVPEEAYGADPHAPRVPMQINFYYEIRQFLDCIEGKREPSLTFERGRYIQRLIDAADLAAAAGTMIEVDEEGEIL